MIGRLPVEEYGASLNLVVAATFRRCRLGWFGGCSFTASLRGFDSRRRRQDPGSLLCRLPDDWPIRKLKLEIIATWQLTYDLDSG